MTVNQIDTSLVANHRRLRFESIDDVLAEIERISQADKDGQLHQQIDVEEHVQQQQAGHPACLDLTDGGTGQHDHCLLRKHKDRQYQHCGQSGNSGFAVECAMNNQKKNLPIRINKGYY